MQNVETKNDILFFYTLTDVNIKPRTHQLNSEADNKIPVFIVSILDSG